MQRSFFVLFIWIALTCAINTTLAAPGDIGNFFGNATTYQVTASKVEISQDNSTWFTLGEGVQQFDIASVNVGEDVDNYMTVTAIPAGTYRYVRVTVSRTMRINGSGVSGAATYYTTANTMNVDGGQLGVGSNLQGNQAAGTIVIPSEAPSPDPRETIEVSGDNLIVTTTLDEPFTVTAGGGTLAINFDTQNTIEFDTNESELPIPAFYPRPPNITIDFE